MIDCVSETTREKWSEVYEMNIYEFFNIMSYAREKAHRRDKAIEEIRRKH